MLSDLRRENADAAAEVMRNAGFDVSTATVDVDGASVTGSDFLMDGGVTASYFYGELAPSEPTSSTDS